MVSNSSHRQSDTQFLMPILLPKIQHDLNTCVKGYNGQWRLIYKMYMCILLTSWCSKVGTLLAKLFFRTDCYYTFFFLCQRLCVCACAQVCSVCISVATEAQGWWIELAEAGFLVYLMSLLALWFASSIRTLFISAWKTEKKQLNRGSFTHIHPI